MPTQSKQNPDRLEVSLTPVLERLQRELRVVVDALPGAQTPTELQRALGVNYNLSWKVVRTAAAATPLEAGPFVPAHVSLRRLASAARRKGLPLADGELERASRDFHDLVASHAGDRASFDTMIAALTGSDARRVDAEAKRAAFRANAQIYGRSIDTALGCNIVYPGTKPGTICVAQLSAIIGLRRLRPDASLRINTYQPRGEPGNPTTDARSGAPDRREPIDPEAMAHFGAPLLPRFMPGPPPPMREVRRADGWCETHLRTPDIGSRSVVSCVLADVERDAVVASEPDGQRLFNFRVFVLSPCARIVQDALIHDDLFVGDVPEFVALQDRQRYSVWPPPGSPDVLPIAETVASLGPAPAPLHARGVPKYREMVEHVLERLGRTDLARFRVFRCEVECPVLNSAQWMRFKLEAPSPGGR